MTAGDGGVEVDGSKITAHRAVAEEMKRAWSQVRGGIYTPRRGTFNWATWEWPTPRTAAIFFADATIGHQIDEATIVWHLFGRIPDPVDGADDELLEELRDDAVRVLNHLVSKVDDNGNGLLLGFFHESVTIQEAYSIDDGVQGIVVLFDVGI